MITVLKLDFLCDRVGEFRLNGTPVKWTGTGVVHRRLVRLPRLSRGGPTPLNGRSEGSGGKGSGRRRR